MSSIVNLSVQQLRKAATLKERIQSLEKELNHLLGSAAPAAAGPAPKKKKFKLRCAKVKGAKPAAKPAAKKDSRKMSAAAKAKLSAKLKAIWAARKAAKK